MNDNPVLKDSIKRLEQSLFSSSEPRPIFTNPENKKRYEEKEREKQRTASLLERKREALSILEKWHLAAVQQGKKTAVIDVLKIMTFIKDVS